MKNETIVIGVVDCLYYKADRDTHSVNYFNAATAVTEYDGPNGEKFKKDQYKWFGTFKAAIGTYDEVKENLRLQVANYLKNSWAKLKPGDFDFSLQYTEVKDGNFWLIPCTSRDYRIPVEKKA